MNLHVIRTLGVSALRSAGYLLTGRITFPRDRLGDILETPDSDEFIVYRETELRPTAVDTSDDAVVLVFRMQIPDRTAGETLRGVLFDPLANVATPFFAGMPGFRRKLWLAGRGPGNFLELYEWASAEDAERFVAALRSLLEPFDFAGSATFDIVEDDSIDEYVDDRSVEWRDAATASGGGRRGKRLVGRLLATAAVLVVGYLVWRWGSRTDRTGTQAEEEQT